MARDVLFDFGVSGASLTAIAQNLSTGVKSAPFPLIEDESTGEYYASFPSLPAGDYYIRAYQDGVKVASPKTVFAWDGTAEVAAFGASDRQFLKILIKGLGRMAGISVSSKKPQPNSPGYLRSSDGEIDQIVTIDDNEVTTIRNA